MDKIRVLVIDDDKIILKTMNNILEEEGYIVNTADSGESGIKTAKEGVYDQIFLDLNIPDMNGLEILRELRKINSEIPITIITGYGTVDSAITAMKLNVSDYILKPLDPEQILQSIRKALKRRELEKEIVKKIPKPNVLLVAGNNDAAAPLIEQMNKEKIQVKTSNNINNAIMLLKEDLSINIVVCDLGRREIDGVAFLTEVKSLSPEMIFIAITSMPDINDAIVLMREGSYDYLVKPIKTEDLIISIRQAWQSQSQSLMNKQLLSYLQNINDEIDMAQRVYKKITELKDT